MTIIATHRRPVSADRRLGIVSRIARLLSVAGTAGRSRPARNDVFALDARMLRDIGKSRCEFMAGELDG